MQIKNKRKHKSKDHPRQADTYQISFLQQYLTVRRNYRTFRNLTMRITLTITFILSTVNIFSQKNIVGKYYHNFGHTLLLKSDSTFEFKTGFDLSSSWSQGTWSLKRDTVSLVNTPIFDTLKLRHDCDTLVLSSDPKSERVDRLTYITTLLSGGGQNRTPHPLKLLVKKKMLLIIDVNGIVVTKDLYDPIRQKYFSTKFYKSKD